MQRAQSRDWDRAWELLDALEIIVRQAGPEFHLAAVMDGIGSTRKELVDQLAKLEGRASTPQPSDRRAGGVLRSRCPLFRTKEIGWCRWQSEAGLTIPSGYGKRPRAGWRHKASGKN